VRDERYETDIGYYDPPGSVRKVVARLDPPAGGHGGPNGALVLIGSGSELRQKLSCTGIAP